MQEYINKANEIISEVKKIVIGKDDIIKKYIAMTRNEELTLLLEIMRKYDLPVSPILEFAIRNKMDNYSGDDVIIPEDSSKESDSDLIQSSKVSPIERTFQHSNVLLEEKTETEYLTRVSDPARKNRKKTRDRSRKGKKSESIIGWDESYPYW